MSVFDHKDTEALQRLADEVEHERSRRGHTPFDDIPESEGDGSTHDDRTGDEVSLEDTEAAQRAEAFGSQSRPQTPGL